jgi:NTE family protein
MATAQTYSNLVFEGAGIRGIAYPGVLKELKQQGVLDSIQRVGGTSAGAITALMVSLRYHPDSLYQIISETKFQEFNDGQFMFVGGFSRLHKRYGWYKGDAFNDWLEKLIRRKTDNADITFRQLHEAGFLDLYITGTCLNKQSLFVFSKETYPDMKVKDAVRISMSVPLYFESVFIDQQGTVYKNQNASNSLDVVVDGGIIGNFPIFIFDSTYTSGNGDLVRIPNTRTLGVRIDSEQQIKQDSINPTLSEMPIENMGDYFQAFYVLVLENLNRTSLTPYDWKRTISVSDTGIGPKVKKLSSAQKQGLMRSGEEAVRRYFQVKN